jgi:hypothetical protein
MESTAAPSETSPAAVSPYRDPEPFKAVAQGQKLCFFPSGSGRLERLIALID